MNTRSAPKIDVFSPIALDSLQLKNRLVMPPLTRSRAEPGNLPSSMAATYYSQRAGAGLIITEATQASAGGQGYIATPGIYSEAQVQAWTKVTDAVHQKGGVIFMQLWHVGRISHPDFRGGDLPVAPSAIAPRGVQTYTADGLKDIPTPRALETHEIPVIVEEFRQAARNAKIAGFDGIEVHGANGYLLDQFLEDGTNQRTDRYGGSIENRARLLLEVIAVTADVWGSDRVGVRLSPGGTFNDMCDRHPQETFGTVVKRLAALDLAYLHLIEPIQPQGEHPMPDLSVHFFRPLYPGTLIVAGGYNLARANAVLQAGLADMIAFGQSFLANPDLVERLQRGAPLNTPDPQTFYSGGANGYIDYPTLGEM
ncbi:alkene reductase [Noviherbaspirillum sp.]|uniref:alkene reductase n=1 Tax=Noviherbaspirillum sp. TaxID=1926288 RepID=UPI002B49EEE9|nr:alkene reductase [Noviherbaspirillum sp.]HJV80932.1 alkene reductase [Noviherbaspirillum sp.]